MGVPFATTAPVKALASSTVSYASMVFCWGDSTTNGGQDQYTSGTYQSYPLLLSSLLGMQVVNQGINAQWSNQIASRFGANATTLTISGNQVVSGSNAVTAMNGAAIVGMATNPGVQLLSNANNNTTLKISGVIVGVHGVLQRAASGGPPSTTETYTFTPDVTVSSAVACPANSAFVPDNVGNASPAPCIFMMGRNNIASPSQVVADVAACVAQMLTSSYLVMSLWNGDYSNEYAGQTLASNVATINAGLAAAYGGHFVDARAALLAAYNAGNTLDVINVANGVIPYSLRAIVATGTAGTAITNSQTSIPLTVALGGLTTAGTILMDSEYMQVTAVAGSTVTVTRGYGGSTAASHLATATWTETDPLHPGVAGYNVIANLVYANRANLFSGHSGYVAPVNLHEVLANPPQIGNVKPGTAGFTSVTIGGVGVLNYIPGAQAAITVPSYQLLFGNGNGTGPYLFSSGNNSALQLGGAYLAPNADGGQNLGGASLRWNQLFLKNGVYNSGVQVDNSMQAYAPSTGNTVTLNALIQSDFINPAGTLAALTIAAPGSPSALVLSNGRAEKCVMFSQAITAVTWTGFLGATPPSSVSAWQKLTFEWIQALNSGAGGWAYVTTP